jgi:colicin import membrane protein
MQRASDRWVSIALSVLLHGALVAALVYGWLLFRRAPQPRPTLAIEATVVDARAVRGATRPPPQPAPPQPAQPETPAPAPEEPAGPPPPTPEELAQREQQRKQAEAASENQRRAAEQKAAAEAAQAKAAEMQRKADEQRQAEARAAAERKARAAEEAQKRAAAEQQRQAQAVDQKAREELRRSLAAEEHAAVPRSSAAVADYQALIAAKIKRAWLRPPTARPGLECVLNVKQIPGGEVTRVSIGQCNADPAVRDSIENAVYRASPLPPPPPGAQFDPDLVIDFKPD